MTEWISVVSIHATLAGGDPSELTYLKVLLKVSIHATLAGGDLYAARFSSVCCVSIHATLAGGDA